MTAIVRDDGVRSGDPRIEGTRITVYDVKRRVIDGGEDPFAVATEYDIDAGAVFSALAYYYEHVAEMREREAERHQRLQEIRTEPSRFLDSSDSDELAEQ